MKKIGRFLSTATGIFYLITFYLAGILIQRLALIVLAIAYMLLLEGRKSRDVFKRAFIYGQ